MIVTGRLRQRTFDDKEGQRRTTVEIDAEDVAVSLMYARATVTKTYRPGAPQSAPTASAGQALPQGSSPAGPHSF